MPVCYTQTCSRDFQETLLAVRSKVFFPYFKMLKNKDEKSGWRTPGSALSAPLEFSLYLSKADVPGRMHTAARGEDGGVQDLNTFHCSSHILFTHSCWPIASTTPHCQMFGMAQASLNYLLHLQTHICMQNSHWYQLEFCLRITQMSHQISMKF